MKQLLTRLNDLRKVIVGLPFTNEIVALNGNIYAVGGIVRDVILDKKSKDLDIIVTGVEIPKLIEILERTGKVDIVGASFGVIKYKEFGSESDIDIALPRTETSTGEKGHKAFDVISDPFLKIEDDLIRRDITINSMALALDGTLIDPFGGFEDLFIGEIKHTNEQTFFEDPLRMLRVVQFAARFEFDIDPATFKMIQDHAFRINEEPVERIVTELEKIVTKGNSYIGAKFLICSGLFAEIYGSEVHKEHFRFIGNETFKNVKTLAEFMFQLHKFSFSNEHRLASDFWTIVLKGDIKTCKEIKALEEMSNYMWMSGMNLMLKHMFNAFKIFPGVIDTEIWDDIHFKRCILHFKAGRFPKSLKELPVGGNDLTELGLKGPEIGDMFDSIIQAIFDGQILSEKEKIIKFIKENKDINANKRKENG